MTKDCKKLNARIEQVERLKKAERRLAKANKLLIRFVWASAYFNGEEADLVAEAKQFLQEE